MPQNQIAIVEIDLDRTRRLKFDHKALATFELDYQGSWRDCYYRLLKSLYLTGRMHGVQFEEELRPQLEIAAKISGEFREYADTLLLLRAGLRHELPDLDLDGAAAMIDHAPGKSHVERTAYCLRKIQEAMVGGTQPDQQLVDGGGEKKVEGAGNPGISSATTRTANGGSSNG